MASSPPNPPSRQTSNRNSSSRQNMRASGSVAHSPSIPQRLRSDESWIDISSQPSSSSLSSINDEIVTTGLRVQQDRNPNVRRRQWPQPGGPSHVNLETRQTGTSSQEEYEESESEDDQVITSSTERITPGTRLLSMPQPEFDGGSSDEDEDDDDENSTALGGRTAEPVFTPQPNAFSHPPSSRHHSSVGRDSYFPGQRQNNDRNGYPARRQSSYSHQTDHDAALRASLTTLLSIGAATARGLPKRNQPSNTMPSNDQMGLRLVPESELVGGAPTARANTSHPRTPSTRVRSSPSISSQEAVEKGKRKASTSAATKTGDKARAEKKRRKSAQVVAVGEETFLSPTLSAWVMSASVLILFSVVGFGAGYVIGREVGRQEVLSGIHGTSFTDGGGCGREVARSARGSGGLRRLNWRIGRSGTSVIA
ncbi:uncharacterized protein BP5553_02975 [Venustampulla echinocandica]|uniref:Uncharacterized protein n=1 Tax=Venustampulla echinocandica TaxID=2656787 RepID=A0A370TSX2_9HELO|nr:uncharacterized protein BP5553_02975 [Venustampulla echinocandica]RDL38635.1 hypothetical protein BP5553_02975 [Venustampulla echinocandica]